MACGTVDAENEAVRKRRGGWRGIASAVVGIAMAAVALPAGAQSEDGPLEDNRLFNKENGLGGAVVLWTDNTVGLQDKTFDFVPPDEQGLNAGLLPQNAGLHEDSQTLGFFFDQPLELVAVDFDGDLFDEYVTAWQRSSQEVRLSIPQDLGRTGPVDGATGLPTLEWTQTLDIDLQDLDYPGTSTPLPDVMPSGDFERVPVLRLEPGDFDGDGLPELAVGYWAADGTIQILHFDTNGTKEPVLVAAFSDESLPPFVVRPSGSSLPADATATRSSKFDLVAGDFDDDGDDDLALVWVDGSGSAWSLSLKAYAYDDSTASWSVEAGPNTGYTAADTSQHIEALDAVAGDFDSTTPGDEIAVAYNLDLSTINSNTGAENWLRLFRVSFDTNAVGAFGLGTLHTDPADFPSEVTQGFPIAVAAADVDADGDDEAMMLAHEYLKLYQEPPAFNQTAVLVDEIQLPMHGNIFSKEQMPRSLVVRDLDPDPDGATGMPEVGFLVEDLSTGDRAFLLQIYELVEQPGGGFEFNLLAETIDEGTDQGSAFVSMSWALALGRFNGPDVSLGTPTRSSITGIEQPLVVLSAPPVHFDRFGAQNFDLNLCFPVSFGPPPARQSCEFLSSYEKATETTLSLTAEFHSDWSLSSGIEGEVSVFGSTVAASLRGSVGEGFSRVETEQQTQTVTVEQRADIDDWIYAATVTYDVWEYPVFAGDEMQPRGHLAVVRPRLDGPEALRLRWFNSKSYLAQSFLPPHEVGNVLSYRQIAAPEDASAFAEEVRFTTSDTRTLSVSGGGSWSLGFDEVTATSTTRSNQLSLEAAVSSEAKAEFPIEGFDPGSARLKVDLEATYNQNSISTQTLSFSESVAINFEFTTLDASIGDTNYDVTPYVYWAENGALVLDYAAAPEIAPPNNPVTWWTQQYGSEPDASFILPWKLDPEKGIALTDESRREQTRDIRIEPVDAEPGDNVTIFARIHNFSLTNSPSIRVRFYLGDPNDAGAIFIGERTTNTLLPQGNDIVEIDWTLPSGDLESARIYAVLDPLAELAEIHENNNRGWSALTTTVPEPGAGMAGLLAVAMLARMRRRRS